MEDDFDFHLHFDGMGDFGDDDFEDPEFEGNEEYGEYPDEERSESESFDIPDLPDIIRDLVSRGAVDALTDLVSSHEAEAEWEASERHVISVDTVFDTAKKERIPGLSRSLFSARRRKGGSFGALLCRSLVLDLRKYADKLLFGLIDNIYLHSTRSITFNSDRICASVRFFWSEEESPYPLILPDALAIKENPEFVYLLIGDLAEELIGDLDENAERRNEKEGDIEYHEV